MLLSGRRDGEIVREPGAPRSQDRRRRPAPAPAAMPMLAGVGRHGSWVWVGTGKQKGTAMRFVGDGHDWEIFFLFHVNSEPVCLFSGGRWRNIFYYVGVKPESEKRTITSRHSI